MIVDLLLALCFINEQSYLPFNHPTQPLSMLSLLLLSTLIERESYAIHLPKRGTMDRRHQNKKWEMGDPMMIKMSDDDDDDDDTTTIVYFSLVMGMTMRRTIHDD